MDDAYAFLVVMLALLAVGLLLGPKPAKASEVRISAAVTLVKSPDGAINLVVAAPDGTAASLALDCLGQPALIAWAKAEFANAEEKGNHP